VWDEREIGQVKRKYVEHQDAVQVDEKQYMAIESRYKGADAVYEGAPRVRMENEVTKRRQADARMKKKENVTKRRKGEGGPDKRKGGLEGRVTG